MSYLRGFGFCLLAMVCGLPSTVLSCTSGRYGTYGQYKVDYSYLDNLDASKSPTLREKIKDVLDQHYAWSSPKKPSIGWTAPKAYGGWTGWTPPKQQGWSGGHHGGSEYGHTTGHGDGAVSHHHVNHGGWSGSGYEFAAHNHQKPIVVSAGAGKKFFRKPKRVYIGNRQVAAQSLSVTSTPVEKPKNQMESNEFTRLAEALLSQQGLQ